MKDTLLLTKILLKSSFTKNKKTQIGTMLLYMILYSIVIGEICLMSYESINALKEINMEHIFINICFFGMLSLILFQNIISSINILFFSKDIEYILPLPVSSRKFLMAKINCLLVSEYILSAITILPALLTYGITLNYGISYYLTTFCIFIIFPIIPVLLVVFIMALIMRFTKFIKNKDFAQYLSIFVTLIICFSILFTGNSDEMSTMQMNNALLSVNNITETISNYFITLKPSILSILNHNNSEGLRNFVALLVETIIFYSIFIMIIEKMYIKIVININSSGNKAFKIKNIDKTFRKRSILFAYLKKEFIVLFRNSIFLIQCVLPAVVFPIIILGPLVISISSGSEEGIQLINAFKSDKNSYWMGIRLVILQAMYTFNMISITAISKDGKDAIIMKYLPIDFHKQVRYKVLPSIITNSIEVLAIVIFSIFVEGYISIDIILILMFLGMLFNILTNYILTLVDLKRPKLEWTSEYVIVKQNLNMVFNFIVSGIFSLIIILGAEITDSIYVYSLIITVLTSLLILIIDRHTKKNINKLFSKIEV